MNAYREEEERSLRMISIWNIFFILILINNFRSHTNKHYKIYYLTVDNRARMIFFL